MEAQVQQTPTSPSSASLDPCMYMHRFTLVCIYIYIYIYTHVWHPTFPKSEIRRHRSIYRSILNDLLLFGTKLSEIV